MDALGLADNRARLARAVIAEHLPALARGHFSSIATALGVTRAQVQQVLELIRRRLRPYPAFHGNAPAVTSYVIPDVIVREGDEPPGAFTVELVEPAVLRLGVRDTTGSRRGEPDRSSASSTTGGTPCGEWSSTPSSGSGSSWSAGRRRCSR
jgi:DNA-directed RNA polymerase specialized sigma54-like protein